MTDTTTSMHGFNPDGPIGQDRPYAQRMTDLYAQRVKAMTQWGIMYWLAGPQNAETLRLEKTINELGAALLRLQQEGVR